MVTIKQLEREIAREKLKRSKVKGKVIQLQRKEALELELKELRKTPSQLRRDEVLKRTGRGFKVLSKKIGAATVRQAKRIRKQQLRDVAEAQRSQKSISKRKRKKGKKIEEDGIFTGFTDLGLGFGN